MAFLEAASPGRGGMFFDVVEAALDHIAMWPEASPLRPEDFSVPVRQMRVLGYSYLLSAHRRDAARCS